MVTAHEDGQVAIEPCHLAVPELRPRRRGNAATLQQLQPRVEPDLAKRHHHLHAPQLADLGIEVRAGLHTGECRTIDGKVGGLAVSIGVNPAEQKGKYLVVFTPAAILGKAPQDDREGDLLTLSSMAYMERRGEAALPPSPYGRIRLTIAPELAVTQEPDVEEAQPPGSE